MKKLWSKGIVMVMAFILMSALNFNTSYAQGSVSLQVFYDELQPYGTWMDYGNYGYVWVPRVDRSFSPYATNGYWINTEYGNTWVSDYSWGWAPFHYGRWFYDDFYGWMWVPDSEWGPAWVAWRSGGGYYGWAPLMPGIGFSISFNHYNRIPHHYWSFVPCRYITYRTVYNHCAPTTQVVNIYNHTTIITNNYTDNRRRTYFTGPSRNEIESRNHERVPVYAVNDRNRPGRTEIERGRVSFYKPEIDNSRDAQTRSIPSRFMRDNGNGKMEQVEARRERTSEFQRDRNTDSDVLNRSGRDNFQRDELRGNDDFPKDIEGANTERNNQTRDMRKRDFNTNTDRDVLNRSGSNNFQRDELGRTDDFPKNIERTNMERDNQNRETRQRDSYQMERSQQMESQRERDAFQRFENERQAPNRGEQQNLNQRREQMERQNGNRFQSQPELNQRQREQFSNPSQSNDLRRAPAQQQFERQGTSRPNQNVERPQSTVTPNNNRSSMPQREQQLQRNSFEQKSIQPQRSGSREGGSTVRKRN